MRFRKLLEQTERDKELERIHQMLNSGQWIFKKPWIFRGTKSDESIKVKDVSLRKGRTPKDTDDLVDTIIHTFYENCYPNYPKRRESIFATTSRASADFFGDLFIIFPNKNAKISSRSGDPHDLFQKIEGRCDDLKKIWENNSDEVVKYIKSLPEDDERMVYSITSFLSGKDMRFENNNIPCPDKLDEYIDSFVTEYGNELKTESKEIQDFIHKTDHAALLIEKYFSNLELNYPNPDEYVGEVMIDGEYLQVEKDLFYEYYKKYL